MALAWQTIDLTEDPDEWQRGDPAAGYDLPDLVQLLRRPTWHASAACRGQGPDPFFIRTGQSLALARALCAGCEVRAECLQDALEHGSIGCDHGMWGGCTVNEREALRRTETAVSDGRPRCVDCGATCTKTRCIDCHNRWARAQMAADEAA